MTVAELRRELLSERPELDDDDRAVIRILLDSGADFDFVREAIIAYLGDKVVIEFDSPSAPR